MKAEAMVNSWEATSQEAVIFFNQGLGCKETKNKPIIQCCVKMGRFRKFLDVREGNVLGLTQSSPRTEHWKLSVGNLPPSSARLTDTGLWTGQAHS